MIRFQLTKERKIILVIGGLLLLWGIGYRLMSLAQEMGSGKTDLELKKQTIIKYMGKIQAKESIEKKRLRLTRGLEKLKLGLLQGQTAALSAVTMQNKLNEIADNISIEIKSIKVLKATPLENTDFISVPVQFNVELTVRQLKRLLYKIESDSSILQVSKLQLRRVGKKLPVKLQATVTISGFMPKLHSTG